MTRSRWLYGLFAVWLIGIIGGSAFLMVHSKTPGSETSETPTHWPSTSRLPRDPNLPTLVMFAHPKCPCTRASIGELATLMARSQGQVSAQVVFFRPEDTGEDWAHTDSWQSAAAIPGVSVRSDQEGVEAEQFHASTSGHVVLYNAAGQLLFSGGITDARGHAGDNEGRTNIVDLLNSRTISHPVTPTFGCPIQEPKTAEPARKGT